MEKCESQQTQTLIEENMQAEIKSNINYIDGDEQGEENECKNEESEVLLRMKKTREMMELLRARLLVERERLARERFQTSSMFMIASSPNFPVCENYIVPNTCSLPDWNTNYPRSKEEYLSALSNQINNYSPYNEKNTQTPKFDPYKKHLENVEQMCNEELGRMEENMSGLKKVKNFWNNLDFESIHYQHNKLKSRENKRHHNRSHGSKEVTPHQSVAYYDPHKHSREKGRRTRRTPTKQDEIEDDMIEMRRRHYVENCRKQLHYLKERDFFSRESSLFDNTLKPSR